MKFHKTAIEQRNTYTYHFANGETVSLSPGENGVTEMDIKELHNIEDSAVYFNIKNSRPTLTNEEKTTIKEWEDKHPGEKVPKNWNLSIEALQEKGIAQDKSSILAQAAYSPFDGESPEVERLCEVVAMLTPDQQKLYRRVLIDEESMTDIAAEQGVTPQAIHNRIKKIKKQIKKLF